MTPGHINDAPQQTHARTRLLPLAVAIANMIDVTVLPVELTTTAGKADHWAAVALFWAMSAGFVCGVGFLPRFPLWKWLFSPWSCLIALMLAALRLTMH